MKKISQIPKSVCFSQGTWTYAVELFVHHVSELVFYVIALRTQHEMYAGDGLVI